MPSVNLDPDENSVGFRGLIAGAAILKTYQWTQIPYVNLIVRRRRHHHLRTILYSYSKMNVGALQQSMKTF